MATALMNGNKTVTATARFKTYTVTLGSHGPANVTLEYVDGSRSVTNSDLASVPYNTQVKITAIATGYNCDITVS